MSKGFASNALFLKRIETRISKLVKGERLRVESENTRKAFSLGIFGIADCLLCQLWLVSGGIVFPQTVVVNRAMLSDDW